MDFKSDEEFRAGVLKCIDSGLEVLGTVSKEVIYSYLAQNQLSREKIPDEPWKFTEALKSLFGRGEEVLERSIVLELKRRMGIDSNGVSLVELLAAIRMKKVPVDRRETVKSRRSRGVSGAAKV